MREQVKNILGGHFRPSAPCCYVEAFPQTAFQGQQAAAVDPSDRCFWSHRRARPGSASGTEIAPQRGALLIPESSAVPAPLIGKSAEFGRLIRQVGR
jgi:hypothetical protein